MVDMLLITLKLYNFISFFEFFQANWAIRYFNMEKFFKEFGFFGNKCNSFFPIDFILVGPNEFIISGIERPNVSPGHDKAESASTQCPGSQDDLLRSKHGEAAHPWFFDHGQGQN